MNCWHCKTELIWGGDHSIDEDFHPVLGEEYSMVTNLSCPKCNSMWKFIYQNDIWVHKKASKILHRQNNKLVKNKKIQFRA